MTQEEFHKRYQYSPTKDCLGEGGFGKVFKAYDTHLDKWVAIKMAEVKAGLEQVRLKHEVEIVNKLPTHPNIAKYDECYTFSSFTGEYDFAVLQYYESGNLQLLLETKQLTEQQKDSILRQILAGIEFLHNQGIIHRDLKPQNILIVNRNGEYIPKITDFGISKKLDSNKSSVFTNSIAGIGTLAYASPEQLRGLTIKKNTDLWSFGVIVCWMFTGKLPFNSANQAVTSEAGRIELFRQIISGNVSAIISKLPTVWGNLVKQCIVVDVEKRVSRVGMCLEILSGRVRVDEIKDTTATEITQIQQIGNQTVILKENTVTDIVGNVYHIIKIGNQEWLVENLKTTRYSNGDLIETTIPANKDYSNEIEPKYQWAYDGDERYVEKFGRLYTWYAATDKRGIAPKGWKIPSNNDWNKLKDYLISNGYNAKAIAANSSWNLSDSKSAVIGNNLLDNNKLFFQAFPSGFRVDKEFTNGNKPNPMFRDMGTNCYWWSSNELDIKNVMSKSLYFHGDRINDMMFRKVCGHSIRCVRDN